jgi:hypothetical protein
MNGAAGTGMTWWWDSYIHPLDLYHHFAGVAAFFRDEDLAAMKGQPTRADFAEPAEARVYGLQADDQALLWVSSRDYNPQYIQREYNRALRDAMRAAARGSAVYSFEDGLDGWALVADWTGGIGVAASNESTDGAGSLELSAAYTGGSWQEAGAFVQADMDWSQYETVTLDIYVPEEANDFLAQVYTKTGDAWTWTNSPDIHLNPGDWNPVSVPLSALGDVSAIREFGVKIGSSTAVYHGEFRIDNVRLSGGAPVEAADIIIEFPDVEGAVLNVPNLPSGTYNVQFWNTLSGEIVSEAIATTADSVDGTLILPLPTFNTDLAIKIKPAT